MSIILLVHALLIGVCISVADNRAPGVSESENNQRLSDVAGVNWPRNREVRQKRDAYYNGRNGLEDPYKDDTSGYDGRIGLLLFTRYCGPGSRIWKKFFVNDRSYADIDRCCKMHDDCPNFVEKREHYIRYPGLEFRPQYFSRVQCKCDTDFYNCLDDLKSSYASSIAFGYSIFQRNCMELEYPVTECLQYHSFFGMQRCEVYQVNPSLPKVWQWFDVLPPNANITNFPLTTTKP